MSETGTTTSAARLREGPDTTFAIKTTLPAETAITVLAREGEWLRVKVSKGGAEGFVHGGLVFLASQKVVSGFIADDPSVAEWPLKPAARKAAPAGGSARAKKAATIWNSYGGALEKLSGRIGIEPEVAVAVVAVESGGVGAVEGRMVIRFENHWFWKLWGKDHAAVFNRSFRFNASQTWKGHEFRASPDQPWRAIHGVGQASEWEVFQFAQALDRKAARSSISMGLPQIMGFNHTSIGYEAVDEMFEAFNHPQTGERAQLVGFFDFIQGPHTTSSKVSALRSRDFVSFASQYNGSGKAAQYGAELQAFHDAARTLVPAP